MKKLFYIFSVVIVTVGIAFGALAYSGGGSYQPGNGPGLGYLSTIYCALIGCTFAADAELEWSGRTSVKAPADDKLIVCNQALTQCWLADLTGDGLLSIYAANGSTLATLTVGPLNASSASFGDGNITNVGDIDVDSISADGTNILIDANAGTLTVSGPTSHLNHLYVAPTKTICLDGTACHEKIEATVDGYLNLFAASYNGLGLSSGKAVVPGLFEVGGSTTLGDAPGTDTLQINAATTMSGTTNHLNTFTQALGKKICLDGNATCHEYIYSDTDGVVRIGTGGTDWFTFTGSQLGLYTIIGYGNTTLGDAPGTDTLQINAATTASGTFLHLGGVRPALQTASPCATAAFPEGSIFYNDTSDYMCMCVAGSAAKQMHAPATNCF